jgi:hypothetical protein
METSGSIFVTREPWNKGRLVGQKTRFKLMEIWAIRMRFADCTPVSGSCLVQRGDSTASFGACDLMELRVRDVCHGQTMTARALVLQQKTRRPVQSKLPNRSRCGVSVDYLSTRRPAVIGLFSSLIPVPRRLPPALSAPPSLRSHGRVRFDPRRRWRTLRWLCRRRQSCRGNR